MPASRLTLVSAAVLSAAMTGAPIAAQGPSQQQRPLENLQYFPKDTRRDSLTAIMRTFTAALGVRCEFCHAEREGAPGGPPAGAPAAPPGGGGGGGGGGAGGGGGGGPQLNHALDTKEAKKTARAMLRMVDSINTVFLAALPTHDKALNVTCMTCHRGVTKPMPIETVLLTTAEKSGVDSAIARYRVLRTDPMSGRYNFTEQPVTVVAQRLAAMGRHDDALRLLQMNQEFHPTSPNLDIEIASVLIAKGDRDAGIARLRSVLARNPNDRRARLMLTQLGVQP